MSQDDDRIKSLSDEDLELEAQCIDPKAFPNHKIRRELISRRNAKERATFELAEAANTEARSANLFARDALKHTKIDRIIAIIAIIIAIASFIVALYPPKN
jgi:hypothetical protein